MSSYYWPRNTCTVTCFGMLTISVCSALQSYGLYRMPRVAILNVNSSLQDCLLSRWQEKSSWLSGSPNWKRLWNLQANFFKSEFSICMNILPTDCSHFVTNSYYFTFSSLAANPNNYDDTLIGNLYQKALSIEMSTHQENIDLKLRYRNVAISSSTWIEERAYIENRRLHLLNNNMEFLKTLNRK